MMRIKILSAVVAVGLMVGTAYAQTANPAISTSDAGGKTPAAPVAGKNSFTMGEAKKRIESFGFTQISGLAKDDQSIWRGTATKNGQPVRVALDYQGNVTSE